VRFVLRSLQRPAILGLGVISVWLIVFVFRWVDSSLPWILAVSATYGVAAYVILPRAVHMGLKILQRRHVPRFTVTADGLPGDPVNLALIGTLGQLRAAGRRLLFLALVGPVDEIECHRRSLKPLSPTINRPNGVGLRKLIYECLNEWVRHFAGPLCSVDESENWRLFPFDASRYQTAFIIWGIYPSEYLRHVHGFAP
jgi:hypothetical protein